MLVKFERASFNLQFSNRGRNIHAKSLIEGGCEVILGPFFVLQSSVFP